MDCFIYDESSELSDNSEQEENYLSFLFNKRKSDSMEKNNYKRTKIDLDESSQEECVPIHLDGENRNINEEKNQKIKKEPKKVELKPITKECTQRSTPKQVYKSFLEEKNTKENHKFKEPKGENFFRFSFSFEKLQIKYESITKYKNFLEKEMQKRYIDEKFLESDKFFENTKKYLEFIQTFETSKQAMKSYSNHFKKFISILIEKKDLKIDKKNLKKSLHYLENKKLKTNFFQFSFPMEEIELNFEYFLKFKNFLGDLKIKHINESFVESQKFYDYSNKYLQFIISEDFPLKSKKEYLKSIKNFVLFLISRKDLKIDKTVLKNTYSTIKTALKNPTSLSLPPSPEPEKETLPAKKMLSPNENIELEIESLQLEIDLCELLKEKNRLENELLQKK